MSWSLAFELNVWVCHVYSRYFYLPPSAHCNKMMLSWWSSTSVVWTQCRKALLSSAERLSSMNSEVVHRGGQFSAALSELAKQSTQMSCTWPPNWSVLPQPTSLERSLEIPWSIESLRVEKTSKTIWSNCQSIPIMITKPCPSVAHLRSS